MGMIHLYDEEGVVTELPLPEICQVGRHWTCYGKFASRRVPNFWVEIRWHNKQWRYRILNLRDLTRGPGGINTDEGWRTFPNKWQRPPRVSIGELSFELVDGSPPHTFIQNIQTREVLFGSRLAEHVSLQSADSGRSKRRAARGESSDSETPARDESATRRGAGAAVRTTD